MDDDEPNFAASQILEKCKEQRSDKSTEDISWTNLHLYKYKYTCKCKNKYNNSDAKRGQIETKCRDYASLESTEDISWTNVHLQKQVQS